MPYLLLLLFLGVGLFFLLSRAPRKDTNHSVKLDTTIQNLIKTEHPELQTAERAIKAMSDETWIYAIVFLKDADELSIEKVQNHMHKTWFSSEKTSDIKTIGMARHFPIATCQYQFELIQAYFGRPALDSACKHNYHWPEVNRDIQKHQLAVLVAATGFDNIIDGELALSKAVGGLVNTHQSALGALWLTSAQVLSRKAIGNAFSKQLTKKVPLDMWITCYTGKNEEGKTIGYTRGLYLHGRPEFEAVAAPESATELRQRLLGLVQYTLINCGALENGDTFGEDQHERIRLDKKPSELGLSGWVFRLTYLPSSP